LPGVLFGIELVKGRDRPKELTAKYNNVGEKTCGLLLHMLKTYFATGRYVVLDSGFCVLKAVIALQSYGLFACPLIKKKRYWPTMVPGEAIRVHCEDKEVGETDAIQGTMDAIHTLSGA
jgi:hypothetical protein